MLRFLKWMFGPSSDEIAPSVREILWTPKPGKVVREELKKRGVSITRAGFYRRMAELESKGVVQGYWVSKEHKDGQVLKQRWYSKASIKV